MLTLFENPVFDDTAPIIRIKYEEVYLHDYTSPKEARQQLTKYFEFYNHKRIHQALDYRIPSEVYSTVTPVISV